MSGLSSLPIHTPQGCQGELSKAEVAPPEDERTVLEGTIQKQHSNWNARRPWWGCPCCRLWARTPQLLINVI